MAYTEEEKAREAMRWGNLTALIQDVAAVLLQDAGYDPERIEVAVRFRDPESPLRYGTVYT